MAETSMDSSSASAGIDLSQFYQVFFEEAGENLEQMEQLLLELDVTAADDEELNAIFRCAHSIKGGAATFGFADVAELTHQMETLLDKLRRHELTPTPAMVDVLLQSGDALKAMLARHQGSGGAEVDTTELLFNIRAMVSGEAPATLPTARAAAAAPSVPAAAAVAAAPAAAGAPSTQPAPTTGQRVVELQVGPLSNPAQADNLLELFKEITDLGQIEALPNAPELAGVRRFKVSTATPESDMMDLFTFHVSREQVRFVAFADGAAATAAPAADPGYGFFEPEAPAAQAATATAASPEAPETGYGFFDNAPGAPQQVVPAAAAPAAASAPAPAAKVAPKVDKPAAGGLEASTIRVSVEKVDQLINLVGELVITQAMLAQNSRSLDPVVYQQLVTGLTDLDRNTRDLQEAVMSIRMIPMSTVFSRFPRMLRDLANKLGKKVELVTQGEAT